MLLEVKWHGRGGQGVVLANTVFGTASIREGKHVQAFPQFGPERTGGPVLGFTRVSDEPIDVHSLVYSPDALVVIDPYFAVSEKSYAGLEEGGFAIANLKPERVDAVKKFKTLAGRRLYTLNAWAVSDKVFSGNAIFNTPMIGALIKVLGFPKIEVINQVLMERFPGRVGELNGTAVKAGNEEVKLA
jgi:pyruvate ferredoxin oxidoreductase gamma subunit